MGFDPLKDLKFVRLAHERGLGCGDIRRISVVGNPELLDRRWGFTGPFKKMTFASRMQHRIYWGPLKAPLEWSLKTVLAPWAYIASVIYHDLYWYPAHLRRVNDALKSDWGRLFRNWEALAPDPGDATFPGWPSLGTAVPRLDRKGLKLIMTSLGVLGKAIREAPEFNRPGRQRSAGKRP
jgi:hypothetical protein